jgi:regulator of sigma E protease
VGKSADDLQDVASLDALRWWVLQQDAQPFYLEVQARDKQTPHLLRLAPLPENAISKDSNAWQVLGFTGAWSRAVLGEVQVGMPAHAAGLQRGDEVLSIDSDAVIDSAALRAIVRRSAFTGISAVQIWQISREGRHLTIEVTPQVLVEGGQYVGRIGAQVGEQPVKVWIQYELFDGAAKAVQQTSEVILMTLDMLGRLLTGNASLDNLSGPLTMADYAGRSANLGFGAYLSYLALVSISLGVFNLLPLPMLDGGHLLYYLYEAFSGRPPSSEWLDVMQRLGLALLVALMTFSLFNDVVRLGWLP